MFMTKSMVDRWLAQQLAAPARISNIPIGSVAYASLGTSAVHVAGTLYAAEWQIREAKVLTGMAVLNGATASTDNAIVALYNAAGVAIAWSALAGTLASGANAFQQIAFAGSLTGATTVQVKPGIYYAVTQFSGTTTTTRRIAASTFLNTTISQAGSFGTLANLSPLPSATVADVGPIVYGY